MRKLTVIIIFVLTNQLFGQSYKIKTFAIGINAAGTSSMTPDFSCGLSLQYSVNRHSAYCSLDMYQIIFMGKQGNIGGLQSGYNYYFFDIHKSFNVFGNCNLLYVQYGQGAGQPVPYNYLPTSNDIKEVNLYRTRSFVNTFGLGLNFTIAKIIRPYLVVGGGYNYFKTSISPTNDLGLGQGPKETIVPAFQLKIGLTADLYSNFKRTAGNSKQN